MVSYTGAVDSRSVELLWHTHVNVFAHVIQTIYEFQLFQSQNSSLARQANERERERERELNFVVNFFFDNDGRYHFYYNGRLML